MIKYTYNKLVRDRIPENINSQEGRKAQYHTLSDEEYLEELNKKLLEEAHEFIEKNNMEELADVMEVIESIMKFRKIEWEDVKKIGDQKRIKKGGFDNKIYLEYVEEENRNLEEEKELNKSWRNNNERD